MRSDYSGELGVGVTPKDLILATIGRLGTGGMVGHAVEYAGPAIEALSMEGRMTVCNMTIEGGGRAGMIAPDETTFEWVEGRPGAPDDFDAATFVSHGVYRIDKVFVAGNEHRCVITASQRKHINRDFHVEVGFSGAVVKSLELLLDYAKAVAPHPQQESLLSLSAGIDAGIKESPKQAAIAQ